MTFSPDGSLLGVLLAASPHRLGQALAAGLAAVCAAGIAASRGPGWRLAALMPAVTIELVVEQARGDPASTLVFLGAPGDSQYDDTGSNRYGRWTAPLKRDLSQTRICDLANLGLIGDNPPQE